MVLYVFYISIIIICIIILFKFKCSSRAINVDEWNICKKVSGAFKEIDNFKNYENSFFAQSLMGRNCSFFKKYFISKELNMIKPSEWRLMSLLALYREVNILNKNKSGINIKDYVSFSRANFNMLDKVSCDWCSLINGVLQYSEDLIKYSVVHNPKLLESFVIKYNTIFLCKFLRFLPYSVVKSCYNKKELTAKLKIFSSLLDQSGLGISLKNRKKILKNINRIFVFTIVASYLESRWCPFMHLRKISYERSYHMVNSNDPSSIEEASMILNKLGFIDCYQCNKIINENISDKQDVQSIFEEYFSLFSD